MNKPGNTHTSIVDDREAKRSIGRSVHDHGAAQIDMLALRAYRLGRVQEQLQVLDAAGALFAEPNHIRYATGVRNMQPWSMHTSFRTTFIPAQGKATAFEYGGSEHLATGLETIGEVRQAPPLFFSERNRETGELDGRIAAWAAEIAELTRAAGGTRLAIDRHVDHFSALALEAAGLDLVSAARALTLAQSIKSKEELLCLGASISVAEAAIHRLREALEPGMTEIELWAILEGTNAEMGGEYLDTRLLSSGGRTNPWFQEATDRVVRPGDLVALDTDMIGPFGYDADISRTFLTPPNRPTGQQMELYQLAHEQLQHNLELMRPGTTFREMSEASYILPDKYREQEMVMVWHGVGLTGGAPNIVAKRYLTEYSDDGPVEPGLVLCCEAYVGELGGAEGVKLEQCAVVTETGYSLLTTFPFEEDLLGRQI
ncbi:MAG: aminopeptidase P family protein [Rhodospirillaceae bacterium]|jgi:Xaa-Pro dipeptidase|nr:aminopeptidase P family protein [Rhodospirillaceae bacterium]MBT6510447.1 aminopeptidase P family protein [Rhodospirillaceae bacterium]